MNVAATRPAFALPLGFVISIRKPSSSVRALVRRVAANWQGSRLAVEYATHVHVRVSDGGRPLVRVKMMRLFDGWIDDAPITELAPRESARSAERRARVMGVSGEIEPGHAVIVLKCSGRNMDENTAMPTLYLHALTSDPVVQEELNVARDAFHVGDTTEAMRIAREAIPLTAALYITMLEHEAQQLRQAIERSADA